MRIYFVGSHATGKTTLCRYVSRRYGLPMISEVAHAILAEMETSLRALRTDMELVTEYQERVFARQVQVERSHEGKFVSDRAFDNLAYVAEHTTNAAAMMNDQRFRDYMKWVSEGVVVILVIGIAASGVVVLIIVVVIIIIVFIGLGLGRRLLARSGGKPRVEHIDVSTHGMDEF